MPDEVTGLDPTDEVYLAIEDVPLDEVDVDDEGDLDTDEAKAEIR